MAVPQRSIEEAVAEPEQLGRYELLDTIGRGRVGTVHRACLRRAGKPDKLFAIKRVAKELARDRRFAEGFAAVMAHAAQLDHPAHCAIEDIDVAADGTPFVAMELVSGQDLGRIAQTLVERGATMPAPLVAYIGTQIADALWAAHALTSSGKRTPLYHGELAPSDILIGYDGRVRLTGLGAAELRALAPKLAARPGYQSPELRAGAPCDVRSDVFSLGACLYELLTGTKAVPTDGASSPSNAIRRPDSHITRVIPRPLEQIVSRALAEQPQARWQDASEMARALSRWCAGQARSADAPALCVWMREHFAAASADETERLQTWMTPGPGLGPQAIVPPASRAAPQRGGWTDPEERTPARGILMRKLAADMVQTEPTAEELYDEPWDLETPENQWILPMAEGAAPGTSGIAPKPAAAPPVVSAPAPAAYPLPSAALPSSGWARHAPRPRWLAPAIAVAALGALGASLLLISHGGGQRSAIHVQSNPTGIEVFVRGQRIGITPLRRDGLQSGAAAFEFRAPGFETQRRVVELTPGEVAQLQIDLAARPAPALPSASAEASLAHAAPASDPEPQDSARASAARTRDDGASDRSRAHQHHAAHEPDAPEAEQAAEATLVVQPAVVSATNSDGAYGDGQPTTTSAIPQLSASPPARSPDAPATSVLRPRGTAPTPTTASPPAQGVAPSAPRIVTREPMPIVQSSPKVPARAKRMGVTTGMVSVAFTIDRTGAVTNATVLEADPPGVFDAAALRAISTWTYHPKLINGTPVESRQRFRFRFSE